MAPEINVSLIGEEAMAETAANQAERTAAYGPVENADDTRQAQQGVVNDAPVDVNFNAVVCRSQQLTLDALGKNYESNADRRNKIADALLGKAITTT